MNSEKENFLTNPSKKIFVFFTIFWLLGTALLILSTTNLFTENFFQRQYLMIYLLMFGATLMVFKLYINYWKNKDLN